MLAASACSSSESVGDSSTTRWNRPCALCASALHLDLLLRGDVVLEQLDARLDERPVLGDLQEAEALHALHDQAQRPVGELEHLVDVGQRADPEEVALDRIVDRRVALGDDADHLALAHGVVHERDRALAGHRQRQDGVGEQDRVAERQEASSAGTSVRSTSCTPLDSKSGARSSLGSLISSFSCALSRARQRVGGRSHFREEAAPAAGSSSRIVFLALLAVRHSAANGTAFSRASAISVAALGADAVACPAPARIMASSILASVSDFICIRAKSTSCTKSCDALLLGVLDLAPPRRAGSRGASAACPGSRRGGPRAWPSAPAYRSRVAVARRLAAVHGVPPPSVERPSVESQSDHVVAGAAAHPQPGHPVGLRLADLGLETRARPRRWCR